MQIRSMVLGQLTGHEAGLRLLKQMYEETTGQPMPNVYRTDRGKPYFLDSPVHFSISHTPRHVFCVLSDKPVGIDAEETDRQVNLALAEKILSEPEKERFAQVEDKHQALLKLWVLKEARAKCSGQGLRGYPNETDFSFEDSRVQEIDGCYVAVIEE